VRKWSILFALAASASVGVFVYAWFDAAWWLPNPTSEFHHVISAFGREIDRLFLIVLVITGVAFIGVQIVLTYAAWAFVDGPGARGKARPQAGYRQGVRRLEILWTIIPAAILGLIAVYQFNVWTRLNNPGRTPQIPPLAEVTARQFEWVVRYPGPDGKLHSPDDLVLIDDLHFVKNKQTLIHLESSDVIHSFYLPHLRVKQDAVPGLTTKVWFDADRAGCFEFVCAELCGWGHYKMRGKVTIHETESDFAEWLDGELKEQNRSQLSLCVSKEGGMK
jgi:cytochrome c oxidase subunit 2